MDNKKHPETLFPVLKWIEFTTFIIPTNCKQKAYSIQTAGQVNNLNSEQMTIASMI